MTAKDYQNALFQDISEKFPELEIKKEWNAFAGTRKQYLPRVDIAFGPFNIEPGPNLIDIYNRLVEKNRLRGFLQNAFYLHKQNLLSFDPAANGVFQEFDVLVNSNQNARCLIAIEIENTNSKKHMMGSIVNASSLGRVGLGVSFCDSATNTFMRILAYLKFLSSVGKNSYNTNNFLVLTAHQIDELVENLI
jgi:hypothetical protein